MTTVVVREYARLTTDPVEKTLDQASVSQSAFDWLCGLAAGFSQSGASLLQVENRKWLRWDSFVGVVETPCGTVLEILPKHGGNGAAAEADSRALLKKMLQTALDLPTRVADRAKLEQFRMPLAEWLMKQFVLELDQLVNRGLRSEYRCVEEQQRYLRGQLDVARQMRQPPGRAHIFNIRHDVFTFDRPENRLLKTALERVARCTQQTDTWRLAHQLLGVMGGISTSRDKERNFRLWVNDRLMAHYKPIRPWCELVLGEHMPLALKGASHGVSLLFPMEKLFERYVEVQLRQWLPERYELKAQARSEYLCQHLRRDFFQLRPDLLVTEHSKTVLVLDTKWKRISGTEGKNKYGLAQSDFYQAFAYGHKYLQGTGEVVLIYPATTSFDAALQPFTFSGSLTLRAMPFDLATDMLVLPEGWTIPSLASNAADAGPARQEVPSYQA
ncbi:McrC family protein [Massilia sp.]|uniref:McrC family protein n=1 Tax=Massilia sp. TaxID=1882437 RepID=UPI0028A1E3B7|nr:McrC family protein [Massilia sp.]